MAGLDILGGIGKGIMIGADQIRQQEAHDANLQNQQAAQAHRAKLLEQQTQQHEWKADAVKRLQTEQGKADTLGTLNNRVEEVYNDLPEHERKKKVLDAGTALNLYTPEQRKSAEDAYNGLVKTFGVEAYDAALRGDVAPLRSVFQSKGLGDIDFDGKDTFTIRSADGSSSTLSRAGLMQLPVMSGAYERALASQKAELARRQAEAEIAKTRAEAGRANRQYQDEVVHNPDGSVTVVPGSGRRGGGARSGSGAGDKPFDVIGTLKDYGDAFGKSDLEEAAFDRPKGYEYFTRIRSNNPGLMRTEDGQAIALTVSRELARGQGQLSPEIGEDGRLNIVANVGPQTYVLESGVSDDRLLRMSDLQGKPLAQDPSDVGRIYLQAFQNASQRDPVAFRGAVMAVRDPGVLDQVRTEAANGDPDARRALQMIAVIQRAEQYASTLPQEPQKSETKKAAPVFSEEEKAVASRYGVDAERKGLPEYARAAAAYVSDKVGAVAAAAERNFFENTMKKIRGTSHIEPGDAKSLVSAMRKNPELQKTVTDDELWALQVAANERI